MVDYYEINNIPLKLSEIKDFRIVQREMVMRPTFRETNNSVSKFFTGKKYVYHAMEPYGVIIDGKSNDSSVAQFKPFDMVDSVVKDVMRPFNAVVDTVGDVFNVKTIKYKKYKIRLFSDRIEELYLVDVPAQLITNDGRAIDIYRNSPEHKELGEKTTSAVELVQALQIIFNTKQKDMFFYGVGFHPINVNETFNALKTAVLSYRESLKQQAEQKRLESSKKGILGIPNIALPKIDLPKISIQIGKPKQNTINAPKALSENKLSLDMKANDFAKYLHKKVRIECVNGNIIEGVGKDIIYGDDKSDDAVDFGVDGLLLLSGDTLYEIEGNEVKSIVIID